MVNLRGIQFNEDIFREAYNEWMKQERPVLPIENICAFSPYEMMAIDNIELDFNIEQEVNCLDIGCANGSFLMGLSKLGLINTGKGIDISSLMIDYAKQTMSSLDYPLEFVCSSIENYNSEDKFDIVTAFDVIEHLVEPDKMMGKIKGLLKPLGFLYGVIPDDHTCDAEVHLHYYTIDTLYKFLLQHFKRITIIPIDLYEGVASHYPEVRLFFRCQRGTDA